MTPRRVDHIGLTVPDIEQAHAFMIDALGFELATEIGPIAESPAWMRENLAVDGAARLKVIRTYRRPDGAAVELFEYDMPGAETTPRQGQHVGAAHVALEVEDIHAAVEALKTHDVRLYGEPKQVEGGPLDGLWWVYFAAPWGQLFEYVALGEMRARAAAR